MEILEFEIQAVLDWVTSERERIKKEIPGIPPGHLCSGKDAQSVALRETTAEFNARLAALKEKYGYNTTDKDGD